MHMTQALVTGQQRVVVTRKKKRTLKVVDVKELRPRDKLIKFSRKCCGARCSRP